jgi:hypothetical protein
MFIFHFSFQSAMTEEKYVNKYYLTKQIYDRIKNKFMNSKVSHTTVNLGGIDKILFDDGISASIPPLAPRHATILTIISGSREMPKYISSMVNGLPKLRPLYIG